MDRGDLRTLGRLQFLTSEEVGRVLEELPFLVRRLATTTAHEEEWSAERVRGPIQWGVTVGARQTTGLPHLFVTTPARRAYQTPENELLVAVLDAVVLLGQKTGWSVDTADAGKLVQLRIGLAERWLQTRALLEVERRPVTTTKLARVRNGRSRRRYRTVLDAYDRYKLLAERVDRDSVRHAVETRGLVSRDDPTLFELICTFRTIRALQDLGWELEQLGLFSGSLRLRGRNGARRLELTYQSVPSELARGSLYGAVQRAHNIPAAPLRPDLVIQLKDGRSHWLVIEAKGGQRSVDKSARAAIYDLLAYRTAFSAELSRQARPFGLGIAFGADLEPRVAHGLMTCTHDHIRAALNRFLA